MSIAGAAKHKVFKDNISIRIKMGPWPRFRRTTIWVRLGIILRSGVRSYIKTDA